MQFRTLILAILLFSGSAAYGSGALVGVKAVQIVVEQLDEDVTRCGISSDALDAAVRLTLANSRMKIDPQALQYLYVNVNVLRTGSSCFASFHLAFNKFVASELATGEFWSKGSIISGGASFVSRGVVDGIESFTKQFVAAWLKANPQ